MISSYICIAHQINKTFANIHNSIQTICFRIKSFTDKKMAGKSKEDQLAEKKQELEKRLQDVSGQLGTAKKATKKGKLE